MSESKKKRSCLGCAVKLLLLVVIGLVIIIGAPLLYLGRTAIYHRFSVFPKQAEAWAAFAAQRQVPTLDDGWTEYRGICHSHSEFSHDSAVPFEDILKAAKTADVQFICMSDHCTDDKADYSLQWKGVRDGVLFVRGFEMDYGFMPWGLPDDTVLAKSTPQPELAKQIADKGGVLFIAHSEEPRMWELPEINGMEIYNIHTDVKDEGFDGGSFLADFAPEIILSLNAYPDQLMRLWFDRQTQILANWDELNRNRKMVGIAANDAHQNVGFIGFYTPDGNLLVTDTSGDDEGNVHELNAFTRTLVRLCLGPLEPNRQLFRIDLDPYPRSLRYVNTHVLMNELSEPALIEALRQGRVFIAFDMLADARGFVYVAQNDSGSVTMGESMPYAAGVTLKTASPVPCRFTVIKDGATVSQLEGRALEFAPIAPGKYRVEAELNILGEWTPWVYTNPIELTG